MVNLEIWREIAADAWPRLGIKAQKSGARISNLFITLTFHLRPAAAGLRRDKHSAPEQGGGGTLPPTRARARS
jgi:hypothetical protein